MSEFTTYYTSADTLLFIENKSGGEPILIDKLASIGFIDGIATSRVFGVGNPLFGFSNLGNNMVNGMFSVRFVHPDYILKAVQTAMGHSVEVAQRQNTTFHEFKNTPDTDIAKESTRRAQENAPRLSHVSSIPKDFTLRMVFNNGSMYHEDTNKSILIKDVRIIQSSLSSSVGDSGPLNVDYRFIARRVETYNGSNVSRRSRGNYAGTIVGDAVAGTAA